LLKNLRLRRLEHEAGQALALLAVTLPLFFVIALVVVDGSKGFVAKRQMQNAADAAALAAARDVTPALNCDPSGPPPMYAACLNAVRPTVAATAASYSAQNGGPNTLTQCTQPSDTNCYTWPFNGSVGKVEVRLQTTVTTFFTRVAGIAPDFLKASARAVASATGISTQHCSLGDQYLNTTPPCTKPGTAAEQGTLQPGINGTQAFTMSPICSSISYGGNGGGTLNAVATNGGLAFSGAGNKKTVTVLGFNKARCPRPPTGGVPEPSGSACTNAANTTSCVANPFDLGTTPLNWPYAPPPPPTPNSFAQDTPYPLGWYGSKCIDLGDFGNSNHSENFSSLHHPPGVYCITGSRTTLSLTSDLNSVGGGQGYTFFALGGATIAVGGASVRFYWPTACGPRPTDRTTFSCNNVSSGYDPLALLYSSSTDSNQSQCDRNAICISGGGSSLDGDIFAPLPTPVFPPGPSTTAIGAGVFVAGNNAVAGSGFIESWLFTMQGTTGAYTGTGPTIAAHCFFGSPPVIDDQYLPTCLKPGTPAQTGTITSSVTGADLGMSE
jgi:Flp pilus assembly protein TadG